MQEYLDNKYLIRLTLLIPEGAPIKEYKQRIVQALAERDCPIFTIDVDLISDDEHNILDATTKYAIAAIKALGGER